VVAVAGNVDLGLIASVDSCSHMVLETMFDHAFIATVALEKGEAPPIIRIFKSGIIAVAQSSLVVLYEQRGIEQKRFEMGGAVVGLEKYYDFGAREFALVLVSGKALLLDLVTFRIAGEWNVGERMDIICPVKRCRAFIVAQRHSDVVRLIDFSSNITGVFSKAVPDRPEKADPS
jgi:hypothetical protein